MSPTASLCVPAGLLATQSVHCAVHQKNSEKTKSQPALPQWQSISVPNDVNGSNNFPARKCMLNVVDLHFDKDRSHAYRQTRVSRDHPCGFHAGLVSLVSTLCQSLPRLPRPSEHTAHVKSGINNEWTIALELKNQF